jgi:hypothetical protein
MNKKKIEVGKSYVLDGNARASESATPKATCLAVKGAEALMISEGLWAGPWPGSGELSAVAKDYFCDLSSAISDVYLPRLTGNDDISIYWDGKWVDNYSVTVYSVLQYAAEKARFVPAYKANCAIAWFANSSGYSLGTKSDRFVYCIDNEGNVHSDYYATNNCICAPTFVLDASKVQVESGDIICPASQMAPDMSECIKEDEMAANEKRDWFQDFVSSLPNQAGEYRVWTDGDEILCARKDGANHLADLLEVLYSSQGDAPTILTGCYDPVEDLLNASITDHTGWWYIRME